jgi:tryptophan 2,3-dioxygenase
MPKKDAGPNHTEYLRLDKILTAQEPLSAKAKSTVHEEMLFIISQQAFELWFKQILHDLDSILEIMKSDWVDEKELGKIVPRLERVTLVQRQLLNIFPILETMTPLDFLEFRGLFKTASGFQSVQFRKIESRMGVRLPAAFNMPGVERDGPNLFACIEKWLERTPFLHFQGFDFWSLYQKAVDQKLKDDREHLDGDGSKNALKVARAAFDSIFDADVHRRLQEKGERRLSHRATQAALLIFLYRDQPILQLPFRLLTLLVDMDDLMIAWRLRHAQTVFRMIGQNPGSAYTAGYAYLRDTMDSRRIFTDLANLSTYLIPRSMLPPLPATVVSSLSFRFSNEKSK